MNRRQVLSAFALTFAAASPRVFAASAGHVDYSRDAYERALASGEPFMLDFFAPW